MSRQPETRHARTPVGHVAFQVFGEGDLDVLFLTSWVSATRGTVFSRTVRDLALGSGICFTDLGVFDMRDVRNSWDLCRVEEVPRREV